MAAREGRGFAGDHSAATCLVAGHCGEHHARRHRRREDRASAVRCCPSTRMKPLASSCTRVCSSRSSWVAVFVRWPPHTLEALLGRNPCAFQAHPPRLHPPAGFSPVFNRCRQDRIQTLLQGIRQIRVHTGRSVLQLHETHPAAEGGVHRAQLEPDIPAPRMKQRGGIIASASARWSS